MGADAAILKLENSLSSSQISHQVFLRQRTVSCGKLELPEISLLGFLLSSQYFTLLFSQLRQIFTDRNDDNLSMFVK